MNSETQQPLIKLADIERYFPSGEEQIAALKKITLNIYKGEMVAIVGPSGSGKSTLMNILGCLDQPTKGSYQINGRETRDMSSDELANLRKKYFGFIFQRYHLLPRLTALENVEIPAIYAGIEKHQRLHLAQQLLQRLGLTERTHHKPNQLSGGQQQRVSIARALINGGDVILADEPTGALDSHSGEEMMRVLCELHQRGHTIILITHANDIAQYAERIIEMHDGAVIADQANTTPFKPSMLIKDNNSPAENEQNATQKNIFNKSKKATKSSCLTYCGCLYEAWKMAWIAIRSHRLRSLLATLGIIIGIASVVSVVALGKGAQQRIVDDISAMGAHTIDIFPGRGWGDDQAANIKTLLPIDLEILQKQNYIDSVTPHVWTSETLRAGNTKAIGTVSGVNEQYFRVRNIKLIRGATFSEEAVRRQAQIAIIDENTAKKLFKPWENPLGNIIFVGELPCTVIAIAEKNSHAFSGSGNLEIFLPYTTVISRMLGQDHFQGLTVRVRDGVPNDLAEKSLTRLLSQRHARQDFFTYSSDSLLKTVQKTTTTLTLFISAIAMIALVVGGIGVMNIMLVSVTERTHEIGIRMAVGARGRDIKQQFLIEAILICLLGGCLGIGLAYGIGLLVSLFSQTINMQFSLTIMVIACAFSTFIGLVFGFLPARNAARLDPIAALARE